jgi:hypothetical protein
MSINIISTNGRLFLNDTERGLMYLFPYTKPKMGDEVFWVDPCFWKGAEHTSRWGVITAISGETITLDNNTEVLISELYL